MPRSRVSSRVSVASSPVEQREFALHRGDRVGGVGPPDALRPGLAQPQKPDLALLDEPRHCADRLLDRHRRIDPVLVIEIDDIDAEPLQARLAGLGDIGRGSRRRRWRRPAGGSGRIWSRSRRRCAGPSMPGRATPRSGPSHTCPSCRNGRRRARSRDGSAGSRPRRRSCRRPPTTTCSRARSPRPPVPPCRACAAP